MDEIPQNPRNSSCGFAEKFTVASPAMMPELANSVISWGSSAPSALPWRSYQPYPLKSPKAAPKPAMFVEPARSAELARNRGWPYSFAPMALTQAPHLPRASRLARFSFGRAKSSGG